MNIDLFLNEDKFNGMKKEETVRNIANEIMRINKMYPHLKNLIVNDDYLENIMMNNDIYYNHGMDIFGLFISTATFETIIFEKFEIPILVDSEKKEVRIKNTNERFEDYLNLNQTDYTTTLIVDEPYDNTVTLKVNSNHTLLNELLVRIHNFNTTYNMEHETFIGQGDEDYGFIFKEKEFFEYHLNDMFKGNTYSEVKSEHEGKFKLFEDILNKYIIHDEATEKSFLEDLENDFISSWKELLLYLSNFHSDE